MFSQVPNPRIFFHEIFLIFFYNKVEFIEIKNCIYNYFFYHFHKKNQETFREKNS